MDHHAGREALAFGVAAASAAVSARRWGIDPERSNRLATRALLRLAAARPTRSRIRRRARHSARELLALFLGSDFRCQRFGTDLFLPHPFGIVVHAGAIIGERCTLFQRVTIGENTTRPGVPTLGNDVVVGAGAAILGDVTIGDGARIGANAVVVDDVEAGATVVGAPARPVGSVVQSE
jgi:serine O-acetyltransferase